LWNIDNTAEEGNKTAAEIVALYIACATNNAERMANQRLPIKIAML